MITFLVSVGTVGFTARPVEWPGVGAVKRKHKAMASVENEKKLFKGPPEARKRAARSRRPIIPHEATIGHLAFGAATTIQM
jgi:hypothetical protein